MASRALFKIGGSSRGFGVLSASARTALLRYHRLLFAALEHAASRRHVREGVGEGLEGGGGVGGGETQKKGLKSKSGDRRKVRPAIVGEEAEGVEVGGGGVGGIGGVGRRIVAAVAQVLLPASRDFARELEREDFWDAAAKVKYVQQVVCVCLYVCVCVCLCVFVCVCARGLCVCTLARAHDSVTHGRIRKRPISH